MSALRDLLAAFGVIAVLHWLLQRPYECVPRARSIGRFKRSISFKRSRRQRVREEV